MKQPLLFESPRPTFGGETFDPDRDSERLYAQLWRVFQAMRDHDWHTLGQLAAVTGDPITSISARLRDLRKEKFGGHVIARRYVDRGLWKYRLESES